MGFFDNFGQKKASTTNGPLVQGGTSLPPPPMPKNKTNSTPPPTISSLPPPIVTQPIKSPTPLPSLSESLPKKDSLFESSPVPSLPSQLEKTTTVTVTNQPKIIEPIIPQTPVVNTFENIQTTQTYNVPDRLPNLSVPQPSNNLLPSFKQYENVPLTFVEEDLVNLPEIPVFQTITPELDETNFSVSGINKRGPLFIRTDNYGQILTNIDTMQNYIKESPNIIYMLKNLKKNTDLEHKNYAKTLEDIQRKLIYVDNVLFATMREIE
jgi:hypothetical protein